MTIIQQPPYFMVDGKIFQLSGIACRVFKVLIDNENVPNGELEKISRSNFRRAIQDIRAGLKTTTYYVRTFKNYGYALKQVNHAASSPAQHSEALHS